MKALDWTLDRTLDGIILNELVPRIVRARKVKKVAKEIMKKIILGWVTNTKGDLVEPEFMRMVVMKEFNPVAYSIMLLFLKEGIVEEPKDTRGILFYFSPKGVEAVKMWFQEENRRKHKELRSKRLKPKGART